MQSSTVVTLLRDFLKTHESELYERWGHQGEVEPRAYNRKRARRQEALKKLLRYVLGKDPTATQLRNCLP